MTTKPNAPNAFAWNGSKDKPVNQSNICVQNGGIAQLKGGKHTLRNVYGEGEIKGGGVYRVVMATVEGTELVWDNSGVKDKWQTNGSEAAFRAMGRAKRATITNVDFKCRKWKRPDGKTDWWKGALAIRDIDECTFIGGRTIGPMDLGQQGNALKPQHCNLITFDGHGMTHRPRISRINGRSGVKKIVFKKCPHIDESGKQLKDSSGKLVFWPDETLKPDD